MSLKDMNRVFISIRPITNKFGEVGVNCKVKQHLGHRTNTFSNEMTCK